MAARADSTWRAAPAWRTAAHGFPFSAASTTQTPLLRGQRDFLQRGRQHLLAVDPNFYTKGAGASAPVILGATPNIRSANGSNLVLKNGTALNSPITFLPDGYTSAAGTAPLVANAGKYNLHLAPNALGAGSALLLETRSKSGTIAVRREFTDWLNLYGQVSSSVSETFSPRSRVADTFTLAASAPNNPFTQAIQIAVPAIGADSENQSKTTNQQLVFGATVKLPHDWQAILDASKNWGKYSLKNADGPIDAATALGILKGTIDIFKDLRQSPIAYGYVDPSIGTGNSPSKSTATNLALRLAGPIPVELPGGKPTATFLFEKNRTWLGGITSFTNASTPTAPPAGANVTTLTSVSLASSSSVDFLPQRSRDTKSLYGEIRFPVIGEKNEIPFVRSLEVQVAGRQDKYDEKADMGKTALIPANVINCLSANRFLTAADLDITCPPADTPWLTGSSSRKTFNPTLSLRWQVVEDLALRASYATGFVPPLLSQLQRSPAVNIPAQAYALFGINYFTAKDPLRGNEVIGSKTPIISYTTGGNPDVLPETSKTSSAGLIFTPRFIPDLRLSVDWTHIVQKDNYYSPMTLISGAPTPTQQSQFTAYLQAHPERFTRGPAADGFSVGPITAIDASIGNVLGSKVDAIDLAGSYQMVFQGLGTLDVSARATYLKRLDVQIGPGSAPVQYAGVATSGFSTGADSGGVRWKGNLGASWSTRNWSLGARVRFFGSYYLDADRSYVVPGQGSSTVPKQIYVDLYGTYKLPYDAELRMTANNAFNRAPPFDASPNGAYYSRFGDPRMGFYTVSLSKKF
ncbi:TonB-dependent receptor domain-containing protein [Burkholderiaceae bacterium UC74_6]